MQEKEKALWGGKLCFEMLNLRGLLDLQSNPGQPFEMVAGILEKGMPGDTE